jgi:hypothetical protein
MTLELVSGISDVPGSPTQVQAPAVVILDGTGLGRHRRGRRRVPVIGPNDQSVGIAGSGGDGGIGSGGLPG